jgi:hypothetical protein
MQATTLNWKFAEDKALKAVRGASWLEEIWWNYRETEGPWDSYH